MLGCQGPPLILQSKIAGERNFLKRFAFDSFSIQLEGYHLWALQDCHSTTPVVMEGSEQKLLLRDHFEFCLYKRLVLQILDPYELTVDQ